MVEGEGGRGVLKSVRQRILSLRKPLIKGFPAKKFNVPERVVGGRSRISDFCITHSDISPH